LSKCCRYELLTFVLSAFKVDVVLVMGHDRLYQQLLKTCTTIQPGDGGGSGSAGPTVVKLPRSGGVVQVGNLGNSVPMPSETCVGHLNVLTCVRSGLGTTSDL